MKELLLKVPLPNGSVLGVVTFSNIEATLKIALLSVSLVYTVLHVAVMWRKLKARK